MLTPEEVKALADGLTRKKAANEKPVTRETFLNRYRSCSNDANLMAAAVAKISVITVRMQTATMSAVYTR